MGWISIGVQHFRFSTIANFRPVLPPLLSRRSFLGCIMSSPPPDITVTDPDQPEVFQRHRPLPISVREFFPDLIKCLLSVKTIIIISSLKQTSLRPAELLLPPGGAVAVSHKFSEPHSPTPTLTNSNDDASINPPSPTLSAHSSSSMQHITSTDNKPEDKGLSSSSLLKPDDVQPSGHHGRRGSTTSSQGSHVSFEQVERDHPLSEAKVSRPLRHTPSHATSVTVADPSPSGSLREKSRRGADVHSTPGSIAPSESDKSGLPANQRVRLEEQEDVLDPAPFKFRSIQLAALLDPKNFLELMNMGGINAIMKGLGTHPKQGLSVKSQQLQGKSRRRGASVEQRSVSSREATESSQVALPGIVVTSPSGVESKGGNGNGNGGGGSGSGSDEPAYMANLDIRRLIFGENALPPARSKTLLELMWLALKDKVLVRSFLPSVLLFVIQVTFFEKC
jgi:Ca2+-transporting ATPase